MAQNNEYSDIDQNYTTNIAKPIALEYEKLNPENLNLMTIKHEKVSKDRIPYCMEKIAYTCGKCQEKIESKHDHHLHWINHSKTCFPPNTVLSPFAVYCFVHSCGHECNTGDPDHPMIRQLYSAQS